MFICDITIDASCFFFSVSIYTTFFSFLFPFSFFFFPFSFFPPPGNTTRAKLESVYASFLVLILVKINQYWAHLSTLLTAARYFASKDYHWRLGDGWGGCTYTWYVETLPSNTLCLRGEYF